MIEHLASALYAARLPKTSSVWPFEELTKTERQSYMTEVRAILLAIREPSDKMERMGDLQSGDCIAVWQAMIDAASVTMSDSYD